MNSKFYILLPIGIISSQQSIPLRESSPQIPYQFPLASDSVITFLNQQATNRENFGRRTLYTWTTNDQITDLRKDKKLLTKSKSDKGYAIFDLHIRSKEHRNTVLGKILGNANYQKKRFAWTNPWATVMGWEREKYGQHLIKLTLRKEAILAYFNPARPEGNFLFRTAQGDTVSVEELEANPERLAAIYFINETYKTIKVKAFQGTFFRGKTKMVDQRVLDKSSFYREYVLVNESMIEDWEYASENLKEELSDAISRLTYLANYIEDENLTYYYAGNWQQAMQVWNENYAYNSPKITNLRTAYLRTLSFLNENYDLTPSNVRAIVAELQEALSLQQGTIMK